MDVLDTPIYKAIAPRVRKRDHAELARMLGLAIDAAAGKRFEYAGEGTLATSFIWDESPQGYEYWCELDRRLSK